MILANWPIEIERREIEEELARQRGKERKEIRRDLYKTVVLRGKAERALFVPLRGKMRRKLQDKLANLQAMENDLIYRLADL